MLYLYLISCISNHGTCHSIPTHEPAADPSPALRQRLRHRRTDDPTDRRTDERATNLGVRQCDALPRTDELSSGPGSRLTDRTVFNQSEGTIPASRLNARQPCLFVAFVYWFAAVLRSVPRFIYQTPEMVRR